MAADNVTMKILSDVKAGVPGAGKVIVMDSALHVNGLVVAKEVTFTETGLTTYTGNIAIPANAYLIDVIVHAVALWDDGTSASIIVGDVADPNGFFVATDLKATELVAGEAMSYGLTGGREGADFDGGEAAGDHSRRRFLGSGRVVTGVITTGGQDGTAGRTRLIVVYAVPTTSAASGV